MSALVIIRAARSGMSAIERRVADFILDNASLLRDYSSQQLANALQISQSSVVKFSQKLGFKGYPDLKLAIITSVARVDDAAEQASNGPLSTHPISLLADELAQKKSAAQDETRLINDVETISACLHQLMQSKHVMVYVAGSDHGAASDFAMRLSMLGKQARCDSDPGRAAIGLAAVEPPDTLLIISEYGNDPALRALHGSADKQHTKVVSITRNSSNPLRAMSDICLLVSAHDEHPLMHGLLFQHCARQLLDLLLVLMCDRNPSGTAHYARMLERFDSLVGRS